MKERSTKPTRNSRFNAFEKQYRTTIPDTVRSRVMLELVTAQINYHSKAAFGGNLIAALVVLTEHFKRLGVTEFDEIDMRQNLIDPLWQDMIKP